MRVNWDKIGVEDLTSLQGWRRAHPELTLSEIEQEVDRRLRALRAGLVEDLALDSPARHWRAGDAQAPRCPACGQGLEARGSHHRYLSTDGDHTLVLERTYGACPACGSGLFPPGPDLGPPSGEPDADPAGDER